MYASPLSAEIEIFSPLSGVLSLVTVNAVDPEIGKDIYAFVQYEGKIYKGKEGAEILLKNQLEGIKKVTDLGVIVKVNSVLIPGLNDEHIVEIAKKVKECGASLMNVLPLIPLNKMADDGNVFFRVF